MGQNPVPPVNIPIPTKIGSKMGGAPTSKMVPLVLTGRMTKPNPGLGIAEFQIWTLQGAPGGLLRRRRGLGKNNPGNQKGMKLVLYINYETPTLPNYTTYITMFKLQLLDYMTMTV